MDDKHYEFGKNWRTFIDDYLTDERLVEAQDSLRRFMGKPLRGRTFLDIGCGSGLFSLAAHRLGAQRVVSFDLDGDSMDCCRELRAREGNPDNWEVLEGSILDEAFVTALGEFDVVYSWGVLHHTGEMWQALENAAQRVRPGGLLYIAIYNRADGLGLHADGRVGSSRFWEQEKRLYARLPPWGKRVIDASAAASMVFGYLVTARNPFEEIREHKTLRGMSWMVDIRDWLGGHPYEYASVSEVFSFVHDRFGYSLENLFSTNSLRNNEFLFARPLAPSCF
ncbi:MAG: class I SAM-dependent methyltransferase [Deltaproteobacteria bacterium]|nr:class I SAM-dependent methyltransferase [Deltaproteobacteria bacterium]